jgi:hypothetical protein
VIEGMQPENNEQYSPNPEHPSDDVSLTHPHTSFFQVNHGHYASSLLMMNVVCDCRAQNHRNGGDENDEKNESPVKGLMFGPW